MFFSTFFKILASLLAISVFFIILFSLLSLLKPNDKNTKFEFIKGNKDSKNLIAVIKLDGPIIRNTFGLSKITSIKTISPNKLKEDLSSLKKLNPKILIASEEFNDIFFKKIDEIDDTIIQGENLDNIILK